MLISYYSLPIRGTVFLLLNSFLVNCYILIAHAFLVTFISNIFSTGHMSINFICGTMVGEEYTQDGHGYQFHYLSPARPWIF